MTENVVASFLNVFTPEEIAAIRLMGEGASASRGTVDNAPGSHRNCTVAWLNPEGWLADKLEDAVAHINQTFFGFELSGFAEAFQYTVYREGGWYGWHMDKGENTVAPRKLSLTIQLSTPDEYDGGEFQINNGSEVLQFPREQGRVYAFPSWVLHQVTPVSRGTRRALVIWTHGPAFK